MTSLAIGRLLRADIRSFVVGCQVSQVDAPRFGALVRAPLEDGTQTYGLIYDILIADDGLVRQLVTAADVDEAIIADNRLNRNVPLEMSVLSIGYRQDGRISHLLPPRPPLSLDRIYQCDDDELCEFTQAGRFGYFRHLLQAPELPLGELLAAHLNQAHQAYMEIGETGWVEAAMQELIALLRDDYPALMGVLGAVGELDLADRDNE